MAEPIRSVLIVGGGTAGWMAAAALQRTLGPHAKVTLVESEDIGIVGVGEATVPPIRDFNAMIGLDEAEFMRETKATLKVAIVFQDWSHVGNRYVHPFGTFGRGPTLADFQQTYFSLKARGLAGDLGDYSVCWRAADAGKVGDRNPDPALEVWRALARGLRETGAAVIAEPGRSWEETLDRAGREGARWVMWVDGDGARVRRLRGDGPAVERRVPVAGAADVVAAADAHQVAAGPEVGAWSH